jgi:hypothetical protein
MRKFVIFLIDFLRNSLCLVKVIIFRQVFNQILKPCVSTWLKNLIGKMPKGAILTEKWSYVISLMIFGAFGSSCVAAETSSEKPVATPKYHHFYFGPDVVCFDLHTNVGCITVSGNRCFWGFKYGYEYLKPKAFYAGVDVVSTQTEHEFNISFRNLNLSHPRNKMGFGSIEARFGYTFAPQKFVISTFLGLSAYLFFHIDHYRHGFEEFFPCILGGVHSKYELTPYFLLGLNLKAFTALPEEKYWKFWDDPKWTQHETKVGLEVAVPFMWYLNSFKRWSFQLEPYFLKLAFSEKQDGYGLRAIFDCTF